MKHKHTTKIVLPRGNGKSMECLKELCKLFYKDYIDIINYRNENKAIPNCYIVS